MGCWDMYCCVCGGPFTPFPVQYYPQLSGVDTKWLGNAYVNYIKGPMKGNLVKVSNYDAYGNFKDDTGKIIDVGMDESVGIVQVYHTLCVEKPVCKLRMKKYQQQFFDVDKLIGDNNTQWLQPPK
jgi:hypothetical protein